jgi:hypothetical protein
MNGSAHMVHESLRRIRSAQIAGCILILNAMLALLGSVWRQMLGPVPRMVTFVDIALGASLLSGRGWRTIVVARCLLGAVVLTGLEVHDGRVEVLSGDWAAAATEILFSVGIVALLIGNPRVPRIVVGALVSCIAVADRVWYLFRG